MTFTVLTALGTRPEAIKLAPVIHAIEAAPGLRSRVLVTAQHRELLDQMLGPLGITPDVDLNVMRPGQTLAQVTQRVLAGMDRVLDQERPDLLLVQGDTTTVFAATLAAFYRGVPVGHVEAGLRSYDLANPFPEEGNRRLTGQLAACHFAPTRRAQENLLEEGVPAHRVHLTGNPVVDMVHRAAARPDLPPLPLAWRGLTANDVPVLVTLHRRESWGAPLAGIFRAIRRAADAVPELHFVYPLHPQPSVRVPAQALLAGHPRIALVEPLGYFENIAAMRAAAFVITDSGGMQEEAPVLGAPVLVVRTVTERPEALEAGTAWLVGTAEADVHDAICTLATNQQRRAAMSHAVSPFGDGHASERILAVIRRMAGLPVSAEPPPLHAPPDAHLLAA